MMRKALKTHPNALLRLVAVAALTFNLSACGSLNKAASHSSFDLLHTYDVALTRFESGHIMEARDHIQRMDKTRDDYPQAQQLLKKKIEPARKRLLAHYARIAKASEKSHEWARAQSMYEQAARFSPADRTMSGKVSRMDLRIRQLRMNTLVRKRRSEDATLLSWLNAYVPPKGLDTRDMPFTRQMAQRQEWVEDRAVQAYREASRYLQKGYPETAYVEIESHLRLAPDSSKGQKLKKRILAALPRGLKMPRKARIKLPVSRLRTPRDIKAGQIRQLMQQGKLRQANEYALHYRRSGGKDADALLKAVRIQSSKAAGAAFEKGRRAFREERLTDAVRYWRRAVELMPDETSYAESLRRAEQLRERLQILRSGK